MNTGIKRTAIALAITAAFVLPATAFAWDKNPPSNPPPTSQPTQDPNTTQITTNKVFTVDGKITVNGTVPVNGDAEAVIHDGQGSVSNGSVNNGSTNRSSVGGSAAQGAQGNVGVNVASGDNNVQANEAALAASDASDVFGMAQVYNGQISQGNTTTNTGATNSASLSGSVMQGASGNLNVNVAAGSNNLQKNALAASGATNSSAAAIASIQNTQLTTGNNTSNNGLSSTTTTSMVADFDITLGGKFAGITDQDGNQYLDTWSGALPHPSGTSTGHIDLDDQIQNANDRPVSSGLNADGTPNGDLSTGGGLSFNTAGDISLGGTASGSMPVNVTTWTNTTNTAGISGSAFMNAMGNIGVNVASGSNNLQSNILSIASSQGGTGTVPGGGGVEQ